MSSSNEIVQIQEIDKGLTALNTTLNKTAENYLTLVKTIENGSKTLKDNAISFETLSKAQKETTDNAQKLDALGKQLQQSEAKLKQTEDERLKVIIQNRLATQEATKAISDKVKAEQAEEGSLVRMRQRLKELTAEYDKAGVRTKEAADEINNLSKQIGKAEEATNRGQRSVGQYGKIWDGLKGMLPALGVAAIGTAVVATFTAIKDSTGATADAFNFAVSGMKTGLNFFWQTLATGDWSNFTGRMKEAIEVGYKYAQMIDEIEDQTRSLSMLESDKLQENIDLEIQLRNKNLSPEKRKELGEQRIKNEEEFVQKRSMLAKKNFDNEMMDAKFKTKLSEDQLLAIAKDIDSQKRLDAVAYNEKVSQLAKMRSANTMTVGGGLAGGSVVSLPDTPEMLAIKSTIDATDKGVKEYAVLLNTFDILTDESKDKFAKAYIAKNEAAVSGKENIKKVYTMVNNMTKEMTDADKKAADEQIKIAKEKQEKTIEGVELQYSKEKEATNQKYITGLLSAEDYNDELLDKEEEYLKKKQALYKADSKEFAAIQLQLQQIAIKRIEEVAKHEKEASKQASDLYKESLKEDEDANEKEFQESLKWWEKTDEEKKKKDERAVDDKKDLKQKEREAEIDLAYETMNGLFNLENAKLEQQLSNLEKEKAAKLSNKNLTEAQKVKIEAEYDKKSAAIKNKEAQNDKKQALFNIAINTAVAVTKALPNIALSILVGALGAVQAAFAMAQPIPKFAKGTKNAPDKGIFGEAGRELMFLRSGETMIAEQPTYFEGNKFKGAKILSNPETEKLIKMDHHSVGGRQMTDEGIINELRSVKKAILNKPVMIFNEDYKVIGQKTSHSQEIYLNRLIRQ